MDILTPILGFDFLKFILRPLGNYGSDRMDDDGMNWWNEESGRKRGYLEKTHAHGVYSPQSPHSMNRDRSDNPSTKGEYLASTQAQSDMRV